jgi:hypothetical protein
MGFLLLVAYVAIGALLYLVSFELAALWFWGWR